MKTKLKKIALLLTVLASVPLFADANVTKISTDLAPSSPAYSQGIQAGDFVFVAGQIGMDEKGTLVGETIEEQTKQALKNIETILAVSGLTFDNVVKTQIFLKDAKDFTVVNGLYLEAFTGAIKPARTTVITSLPKNALIEIECTAYAPQK